MNAGAVLVGLAFTLVAGIALADPFLKRRQTTDDKTILPKTSLPNRNQEVLLALRDLDFDFQTGKVTELDYDRIRSDLIAQAATLIQDMKGRDAKLEDALEKKIKTYRQSLATNSKCPRCEETLLPEAKFCSKCGLEISSRCFKCGTILREDDSFCSSCGESLKSDKVNND
jgi:hypothetical protein